MTNHNDSGLHRHPTTARGFAETVNWDLRDPERTVTKSWIQTSPGVCGVEPCVRNTRHTVSGLVEWKRQGVTDARILEHHPDLTPADLEAAWAYYATHREEIEQAIKKAAEA